MDAMVNDAFNLAFEIQRDYPHQYDKVLDASQHACQRLVDNTDRVFTHAKRKRMYTKVRKEIRKSLLTQFQ